VYLEQASNLREDWTVTLSHESLELLADPEANLLVQGPDPKHRRRKVYYWFEMCDPVQTETYVIDDVKVSNFVLPMYFTASAERSGRNDFLGTRTEGRTIESFGVNPGGYAGYFDPRVGKDRYLERTGDAVAHRRIRLKSRFHTGRGVLRRNRMHRSPA
jgi:hypothetical protein